jgi:hypothetical protein
MLNEQRAVRLEYDATSDTATVVPEAAAGDPRSSRTSTQGVTLLMDAAGFLVGVDVSGPGLERVVLMLGPHEAVARTQEGRADVGRGSSNEVVSVRVAHARRTLRAHEPNPYASA